MKLRYECVEGWPPLAWLAACPPGSGGSGAVLVRHGPGVETWPGWFCEAIWDGDYAAGRFDQTDIVFGSGGRVDEEGVTFVGSGTMVDRLHSMNDPGGGALVSNSLVCLLAAVGAEVDVAYGGYRQDFLVGATGGIDGRKPELKTSAGPVRLTYHHNLRWDGSGLMPIEKPNPPRDFGSFERYRAFLDDALARLAANMSAPDRSQPYRMLGTLSSGYDSPAAVALARPHGLREAISFSRSKHGTDDSGEPIARPLGIDLTLVDREAWRRVEGFPEVPLLASNAEGEDVLLRGAEPMLSGRVLLTGAYGDIVWGMNREKAESTAQLRRTDTQGTSMAEYRLWAGFLHCPVPFIGARQGRDLQAISRSAEMAAWDVGGEYNRPICRRIVEGAGVPRGAFGVEKKAAAVMFNRIGRTGSALTPRSLRDYLSWSETDAAGWAGHRGLRPATRARLLGPVQWIARSLGHGMKRIPRVPGPLHHAGHRLVIFGDYSPLFPHLFPWALERAKSRYGIAGASDPGPQGPPPEAPPAHERSETSSSLTCS